MNRLCVCLLIVRYARDERFQILSVIFRKQRIPCILKIDELEKKGEEKPRLPFFGKTHIFTFVTYAICNRKFWFIQKKTDI